MSEFVCSINPEELGAPSGYANGRLAPAGSRMLCIAGQLGWNEHQRLVSEDFSEQFGQALRNVAAVLKAAGGEPAHLMRMTIYVTDKADYLAQRREVGRQYRAILGRHYPAMVLVQVAALLEPAAKVEISADAALPA